MRSRLALSALRFHKDTVHLLRKWVYPIKTRFFSPGAVSGKTGPLKTPNFGPENPALLSPKYSDSTESPAYV